MTDLAKLASALRNGTLSVSGGDITIAYATSDEAGEVFDALMGLAAGTARLPSPAPASAELEPVQRWDWYPEGMDKEDEGGWVSFRQYSALRAERERLERENERLRNGFGAIRERIANRSYRSHLTVLGEIDEACADVLESTAPRAARQEEEGGNG